jgi:hypothetical protein
MNCAVDKILKYSNLLQEQAQGGNLEPREIILVFRMALPPAAVDLVVRKPQILSPVFSTQKSKAEATLNIIRTEICSEC